MAEQIGLFVLKYVMPTFGGGLVGYFKLWTVVL